MDKIETKITREELYELLWSAPTIHVAKRFGISDVAINKICRKHNIPKPPLGYWAKIQFGQTLERTPLPSSADTTLITIRKARSATHTPKETASAEQSGAAEHQITVKTDLSHPHLLVKKSRQAIRSGHNDKYGRLRPDWRIECLDISVSKENLDRALRLMDAILKALEERGYTVSITNDARKTASSRPWATFVTILDEAIAFRIEEPSKRSERIPTEMEKKRGYYEKHLYSPSGQLNLIIDSYTSEAQKKWADTKSELLETRLMSFIPALEIIAREKCARTTQRIEEAKRFEEDQRKRNDEKARIINLEAILQSWQESKRIRELTSELEKQMKDAQLPTERESELREWIDWARNRACEIDPLGQLLVDQT